MADNNNTHTPHRTAPQTECWCSKNQCRGLLLLELERLPQLPYICVCVCVANQNKPLLPALCKKIKSVCVFKPSSNTKTARYEQALYIQYNLNTRQKLK
jgi:hypothetical protein